MSRLRWMFACGLVTDCLLAAPAASGPPEDRWPVNEAYPHKRYVVDNSLVSEGEPDIRIQATDAFEFVGRTRFLLNERADAEVFLFAETKDGVIKRYLQVQFEALRDGVEGNYRAVPDETETLGGDDYMVRYWCFDRATVAEERPESDVAHVQRMIHDHRLRTAGVDVGVRFIRLLGEHMRAEVLLIYGEQTALTGVDCQDEEAAMAHLPSIRARAFESFRLPQEESAGE